jgi:uncharacterized MAPEG superfamily protein
MPFAFWCLLIGGLMPVFVAGIAKWGTALDNNNPRDWAQTLTGYRRRAYAAHLNAFEAFPLFAAGVLTAETLAKGHPWADALALVWVVARIGYVVCYLGDWSTPRSLVWITAWLANIGLFLVPVFG